MSTFDFYDWYSAVDALLLERLDISIQEIVATTDTSMVQLRAFYREGVTPEQAVKSIRQQYDPEAAA